MSNARICLLGGFEAFDRAGTPVALPTRKSQALAAILSLSDGASLSRDRLLGLLWGDRGEEQARHSLSQALTGLRRAFGMDAVIADRNTVAFDPKIVTSDVTAFLACVRDDRADRRDDAIALLRGPLLPDFPLRDAAFEDWLTIERGRFTRIAVAAMLRFGTLSADRGDRQGARMAFDRALRLDPLSESAHAALMWLDLDQGCAAAALQQYDAAAQAIRRDLGAPPGEELEAARRAALMQDAAEPSPMCPVDGRGERKHGTAMAVSFWPARGTGGDIEDVQAGLDAAIAEAAALVRDSGGHIVQRRQDGLLCAFGIPTAAEDHAARACRVALAMREHFSGAGGTSVGMRIAIDSGEFLLKPDADGSTRVFGIAPQRAGRIVALTGLPPIVVTDVVPGLVKGRIAFVALAMAPQMQDATAIRLFEPLGAADAAPAQGTGVFIGRADEIAVLADACTAASTGDGRLVAISGEPGLGKSRLVREFVARSLPPGWRVLATGADPQFAASAYHPVRRLLGAFFDGEGGADPRTRIGMSLARLGLSETIVAAPLLALLGLDPGDADWARLEPGSRRRRMIEAVILLLHRQSQITPLLIAFEDLHWLDSASRDVLEELVTTLASARIVLLVNFRPEFTHDWAGRRHVRFLNLDPLHAEATRSLLARLLGTDPSLTPLTADLAARTGGNPFFLEECVQALIAAGAIAGSPGAYHRVPGMPEPSLPETVHAVIGARLDRLHAADRRLLQVASVIGTDVPWAVLRDVSGLDETAFEAAMRRLQAAELLLPARIVPERAARFKHALTHDVVHASLLRDDRRDLHARVLQLLETGDYGPGAASVETLARHAVAASAWPKAARYAREAGARAAAANANRAAVGYFSQALAALAHLPAGDDSRTAEIDLHFAMRDGLFVIGEHDRIPAHLDAAARIAEEIGDTARLCRARLILSGWRWTVGRHREALRTADDAMALARQRDDTLLLALSQYRRGVNLHALGAYRDCATALLEAIALLEAPDLAEAKAFGGYPVVFCRNFLTWALAELGCSDESVAQGRAGWDMAWSRPNNYSRSVMSFGWGHALIRLGRRAEAREVLESGLALYGIDELPATYPMIAAPLGFLLVEAGETESGFGHLQRANEPAIRRMAPVFANVGIWLAEAQRLTGDLPAARATLEAELDRARAQEEAGYEAIGLRCLGDLLARDAPAAAEAAYDAALAIARPRGMRPLIATLEDSRARLRHVPDAPKPVPSAAPSGVPRGRLRDAPRE